MDLAKIRKKALRERDAPPAAPVAAPSTSGEGVPPRFGDGQRPPGNAAVTAEPVPPVRLQPDAETPLPAFLPPPLRRVPARSPLEIILAGRTLAGHLDEPQEQGPAGEEDFEEILCIRVSNETYGISIMRIKEIITPRQVTEIPRAPSFVRGVVSLRGAIIPILDMVERLELSRTDSGARERVVVVRSSAGESFTGLLVDQVTHVARIPVSRIEPAPATLEGIDREFVRGIGRSDSRMVILLNIDAILDIHLS